MERGGNWLENRNQELIRKLSAQIENSDANSIDILRLMIEHEALTKIRTEDRKQIKLRNAVRITSLCVLLASVFLLVMSNIHLTAGAISASAVSEGVVLKGEFSDRFGYNELRFDELGLQRVQNVQAVKSPISESEIEVALRTLYFDQTASLSSIRLEGLATLMLRVIDGRRIQLSIEANTIDLRVHPGEQPACIENPIVECELSSQIVVGTSPLLVLSSNGRLDATFDMPTNTRHSGEHQSAIDLLQTRRAFSLIAFDEPLLPVGGLTPVTRFLRNAEIRFLEYGDEAVTRGFDQSVRLVEANGVISIELENGHLSTKYFGQVASVKTEENKNLVPNLVRYLWQNKTLALYVTAFFGILGILSSVAPKLVK